MGLALDSVKYKTLDYPLKLDIDNEDENFNYVKLAMHKGSPNSKKILFVLDYVPSEDLRSGRMLSKGTGELLKNIIEKVSEAQYLKARQNFSWMACSFHACRTVGKPDIYKNNAKQAFGKRIEFIISKYEPDVVVLFGQDPVRYFYDRELEMSDGKMLPWHGVPVKKEIRGVTTTFYSTLSLHMIANGISTQYACIGYVGRNLANAITNKHRYRVDVSRLNNHKSILIDTIAKFDKLMEVMRKAPIVSIDSETQNLNKIVNKLLTVQFSKCSDYGYVVPIHHKDTPFDGEEVKYIKKTLRAYFEGNNKNKYHIYANGGFDLNIFKAQLNIKHYANNVYDIFAAEFVFDENYKFLLTYTNEYYYSLGNLSVQYGFTGYLTAEFGKKDRGSIYSSDLTKDVLRYCTLDTVVPFAIHEKQLEQAEYLGHKKFLSVVTEQISDQINTFSVMESNGNPIDVNYLFYLKTPNSPIQREIKSLEDKIVNSKAGKRVNKLLQKGKNIASKGLFGEASLSMFSLNKNEHKQKFFFDVLGLQPLEVGKNGVGKIDKAFQKHYADVPEVQMFTDLSKAKKLRNAYVNSFIDLLGKDDDLKKQQRIRPRYHYLKVITGRNAASDPNLQQIPGRSKLAKLIKRLFVALPGELYIKVDYAAHEVRCWGLISLDKGIAELFAAAKKIKDAYKLHPSDSLRSRLESEADIHIMNASYFFGVPISQMMADAKLKKGLRDDVKGVIFGLIYQMSMKSLARSINKELDFTKELVANFNKRFPNGLGWIDRTKAFARKHLYYENPVGLRRHLWGYVLPDSIEQANKAHAEMDRRAVNSPIQGFGAQCMAIGARYLDKKLHALRKKKTPVHLEVSNSVHDSLENRARLETFIQSLALVEESLTLGVREVVAKRHNFNFLVDLEIDIEIGSNLSDCQKWDGSLVELERICYESFVAQKEELKYDIDVIDSMDKVFSDFKSQASFWMLKQAKNTGWKYDRKKWIKAENKRALEKQNAA